MTSRARWNSVLVLFASLATIGAGLFDSASSLAQADEVATKSTRSAKKPDKSSDSKKADSAADSSKPENSAPEKETPAEAAEPRPFEPKHSPEEWEKLLSGSAPKDADIIAFIDEQIRMGWHDSGIGPSAVATDGEWCRRVFLDLLGRVPSVTELQKYLTDKSKKKKADLVDRLLGSDEYVEEYARNSTTFWTNLLIGRATTDNPRDLVNREGMQQYLRRSFLENKPYDKMVRELVTATGSNTPGEENYNGAVNFILDNLQENAATATAKTAKYFLGMQVQCTQCHNHPFNPTFKQDQFWGMNAFFRQTMSDRREGGGMMAPANLMNQDFAGESGSNPKEAEVFYELRNGEMRAALPTFVDGTTIDPSGYLDEVNRREKLADLIVRSEYLGKAIVNRTWGKMLGYGFTKPVDDMGPHNEPSHPVLLEKLGKIFADNGHDLRRLYRWIALSEAYSLSSRFGEKNKADDPSLGEKPLFSHFYVRQMQAEELYESLLVATEAEKSKGSYEEQEKTKSDWLQQFTIAFGTDEGDESTTFNGTIPQALMMFNGDLVQRATDAEPGSFLHKIANGKMKGPQRVEFLYLSALARKPTKTEMQLAVQLLTLRKGDVKAALQDVWWALLNSNEFILNH